jgi:hypothetical protein
VSAFTDFVFESDLDVGRSISIVATLASIISATLLTISFRAYKRKVHGEAS